jgi:hypothetical protein
LNRDKTYGRRSDHHHRRIFDSRLFRPVTRREAFAAAPPAVRTRALWEFLEQLSEPIILQDLTEDHGAAQADR